MLILGYDLTKPEAREKAIAEIAFLREHGVKEFTDEHGRKIVIDVAHKGKAKP